MLHPQPFSRLLEERQSTSLVVMVVREFVQHSSRVFVHVCDSVCICICERAPSK